MVVALRIPSLCALPQKQHNVAFNFKMASNNEFTVKLAPIVESMQISKTIEIHSLTKEMELKGRKVYSLCVGEPDYQPPVEVIAATVRYLFRSG